MNQWLALTVGLAAIAAYVWWSFRLINQEFDQRREEAILDLEIRDEGLPAVMQRRWNVL